MTVDESRFSDSFRAAYTTAFSEYLRMCTVTSTRLIEGKQSGIEEKLASRMLTILIALENDHLTDKEIEALEYCLLQLTMVTTPTLDPIVTVSPEAPTVVNYQIHANAGIFSLIGQDAAFTLTHAIVFEFGSFSLAGQDATFLLTHSFVADQGSFILTGQSALFTHTRPRYDLELELAEAIVGSPTWNAYFEMLSAPLDTDTLSATGNGSTDSGELTGTGDILCNVYKTTNGGIAEEAGTVEFFVNGISVYSQNFVATDDVGIGVPKTYTFTGLSNFDVLKVVVTEG